MTVSVEGTRVSNAGNGATTVFSFPYMFLDDVELVVILRVDSTGVETVKSLGSDYTVSGEGNGSGGSVTMAVAPALGETLTIYRDPSLLQQVDLKEDEALPVESIEEALDRLTLICQTAIGNFERMIQLSPGYPTGFSTVLPSLLVAGGILVVNEDGDGFDVTSNISDIEAAIATIDQAVADAQAAAAAAAASEAAAAAEAASIAPDIQGSIGTPVNVTAVGGILFSTASWWSRHFLKSNGGAVVISANPQIAAGVAVGQELILFFTSDTDTIELNDGNGLSLPAKFISEDGRVLALMWTGSVWKQLYRL